MWVTFQRSGQQNVWPVRWHQSHVSHLCHHQSTKFHPLNNCHQAMCLLFYWRQGLKTAALLFEWVSQQTEPLTRSNSLRQKYPDTHTVITVWAYNSISFREGSAVGCNVVGIAQLLWLFKRSFSSVTGGREHETFQTRCLPQWRTLDVVSGASIDWSRTVWQELLLLQGLLYEIPGTVWTLILAHDWCNSQLIWADKCKFIEHDTNMWCLGQCNYDLII